MGIKDLFTINTVVGYEDRKEGNAVPDSTIEEEVTSEFEPGLEENKKGKMKIKLKHPGAMTEYCKENGFDGVTCGCLCKAMKEKDPVWHKRAIFAYNFGFKRNKKKCTCMEAIIEKDKKEK